MTNRPPFARLNHFASDSEIESHSISGLVLVSQFYRDGRLSSIGGGADEIMLTIICKSEGTLPGKAG